MTKIAVEYQNYQKSTLMKELAAAAHGEQFRGQTSSATFPEIAARVKAMSMKTGSRILDAGCGNGAFTLPLTEEFPFFVDGIDLSKELIDTASGHASEKCRFFSGDFAHLSTYRETVYDAILCVGSLYWGQPLPAILEVWRRVTRPGSGLILFLNLSYAPLNSDEKEAIGETQFFSALTLQSELSKQGWALCEWSEATASYIEWLKRWCHKMDELSPNLLLEMGKDQSAQLCRRFNAYLTLAQKQAVRRIILRAEHV